MRHTHKDAHTDRKGHIERHTKTNAHTHTTRQQTRERHTYTLREIHTDRDAYNDTTHRDTRRDR